MAAEIFVEPGKFLVLLYLNVPPGNFCSGTFDKA